MLTVEQAKARFQGVVIPLATIFADDGSLDVESTKDNVQWIMDQGAKQGNTVFLAVGSGGDFSSMNIEERKQAIKAIAEVADGKIPIMAGVQSTDIRETIDLCKFCEDVGVELAQIASHYYYVPKPDDVVRWLEEVARHTNLGFAVYNHYYSGARYDMPLDLIDRCLEIPNSIALKWASADATAEWLGIKRFNPKAAVLLNNLMGPHCHLLGVRAYVSHVPNFYPQHDWRIWDMLQAQRYQEAQAAFDEFMVPYFNLVGKIMGSTAGEGVFTRVGLAAAGLRAGRSRAPSHDEAATPEVHEGFRKLLADAKARAAS